MILHIGEIGGSDPRELPGVFQLSGWTPAELLPLYYNAADLYLATSTAEGFSFPIIEAVNSGLPVVAPRIDVFVEVFRDLLTWWTRGTRRCGSNGPSNSWNPRSSQGLPFGTRTVSAITIVEAARSRRCTTS